MDEADTVVATGASRRDFSNSHLSAALHFADVLRQHEEAHKGAEWGPHFSFCTWNASAAIILSFAAIEAAIDEIEDDLGLSPDVTKALERAPTLDRVQAVLSIRGCSALLRGAEPMQSAELLRALRNGLVHPKAEWDDRRDLNARLSRKVIEAKLPLSPFQTDPMLAFPYGCMSSGIAHWGAQTATLFVHEVRARLGLRLKV